MVKDVYSHIIDDERKNTARLFENAFYAKKDKENRIGLLFVLDY